MSNQNARAIHLMDRIQAATGLTEAAKINLIRLINPMTDFATAKYGYAGRVDESPSIVSSVKRSYTVSAPPGTTTTWNLNCFNTPCSVPTTSLQKGLETNGVLFYDGLGLANRSAGPITVITAPDGHALNFQNAVIDASVVCNGGVLSPDATALLTAADVANSYNAGLSAINAIGIEYHDTTAEIAKQGVVAVYQLPQPLPEDRYSVQNVLYDNVDAPTTSTYTGSGTEFPCNDVPGTMAEVMLLNGSQQWEAKHGAYVVPKLNDVEIPVSKLAPELPVFHSGSFINTTPGVAEIVRQPTHPYEQAMTVAPAVRIASTPLQKFNSFNTAGFFIQGLAATATITINTVVDIESFPTARDTKLVVLAQKSPEYDPMLARLYSAVINDLPPGCKVGNNADGDWFFQGVSTIAEFLQPALKALGGPIGIAGSALATAADSWAQGKLKESAKQSNQGKQQPGSAWVKQNAQTNGGKKKNKKKPPQKKNGPNPKSKMPSLPPKP
jgi:hypothetical protein